MPIAAVPRYLPTSDFAKASPALRFGLLLSIWTDRSDQEQQVLDQAKKESEKAKQLRLALGPKNENLRAVTDQLILAGKIPALWTKNDHAGKDAWGLVRGLTQSDRIRMKALDRRTQALARQVPSPQLWTCEAESTSPFTTGLGNEHPLENGFSFLNPYGLPYLPASGVKGVVREAARQLATGQWEDSCGWDEEPVGSFTVRVDGVEKAIPLKPLDVLFGRETPEGESEHFRGVLSFWDVIPQIPGDQLRIEVMTPHQSHYYQQKKDRKSGDSTTPHDSGQPNPILFLAVPPGSKFHFVVTCDLPRLKRVAPALLEEDRWKKLLEAAFQHAFDWLGFGAKTAVGYGAMKRSQAAQSAPASGAAPSRTESTKPVPATASAPATFVWESAILRWDAGKKELSALSSDRRTAATATKQAGEEILGRLSEEQKKMLLQGKRQLPGCKVRVMKDGNKLTLLGLAD